MIVGQPIIGQLLINTRKLILLSYLSHLFRLDCYPRTRYLLEGLQSADKTKTLPADNIGDRSMAVKPLKVATCHTGCV